MSFSTRSRRWAVAGGSAAGSARPTTEGIATPLGGSSTELRVIRQYI